MEKHIIQQMIMCMPRTDAILMTSGEKAVTVRKMKPYSMLEEAVAM